MLLQAVLPAASLAMMAHAGYTIAAGLLAAYLGADAGKRVHAGAVARGSVESIRAVLWYADIRGFTAIADATPGLAVIEMLDEIFETLTAVAARLAAARYSSSWAMGCWRFSRLRMQRETRLVGERSTLRSRRCGRSTS